MHGRTKTTLTFVVVLWVVLTTAAAWFVHSLFGGFDYGYIRSVPLLPLSAEAIRYGLVIGAFAFATLVPYIVYLLGAGKFRAQKVAAGMVGELANAQEQLRRLYDQGPVPHTMLTTKGVMHNPNKAIVRFFKSTYDELEGSDFFQRFHEDDRDVVTDMRAKLSRNVPFDRIEARAIRSDGAVRWVYVSIFAITDPKTNDRYGLVTLVDFTEQKELDEAKTAFVSLASHQLRTPLSTVKWYTGMLASGDLGPLNEKQHTYIEKVRASNEVLIDLVSTLLDVSRIEMGTLQLDIGPVDATALSESVLEEQAPYIAEKQLRIEKQYDPQFRNIQSDERLLRVVFQNLYSNAIKYTPAGGSVTIDLRARGGEHTIVVTDTGFGIPVDQQDKIFSKMFRADNAREATSDGNGLGLYLTKSIVEMLRGEISFTSEENKGTTFTVTFR